MRRFSLRSPLTFSLASLNFLENPAPILEKMREAGAIIPLKIPMIGRIWVTTTYAATEDVMKGRTSFFLEGQSVGKSKSAQMPWWIPKGMRLIAANMLNKDEPDHMRLRKLVDQAFRRQGIREMRPTIERKALLVLNKAPPAEFDLIKHFARTLPLETISDLLGVSAAHRDAFAHEAGKISDVSSITKILGTLVALKRLISLVRQLISEARRNPQPGLLSEMLASRDGGDQLSEDELIAMVFLLLFAGMETTTNLIAGSVWALHQAPEQKAWLLADIENRRETAVEELSRYVSSVTGSKPRYVGHDMQLHGQNLSRGERIMALPIAANYDPSRFDNPAVLKLDRFPNPHLSYAAGIHFCLGLQLARIEVQAALEVIYREFPNLTCSAPKYLKRPGSRTVKEMWIKTN